ncbi:GNAT family N-acetyltransferase [Xanthomonas sp. Kuri4-1]
MQPQAGAPSGAGFALRPWRLDDLEALVRYANDEPTSRYLSDRFPYPYTRADGEAFLAAQLVTSQTLAIEIDGKACGGIGLRRGSGERAHSATLGYWLARPYWGRGLMTRVVAAYVPWVMRTLPLQRLGAEVLAGNPASARVLLGNGFVEEGLQRCAIRKRGRLHDVRLFARIAAGP